MDETILIIKRTWQKVNSYITFSNPVDNFQFP